MLPRHDALRLVVAIAIGSLLAAGTLVAQEATPHTAAAVQDAPNLEPHFVHPEQVREAREKLDAARARAGRPPNIVLIVVDDMGWGDPGVYGGGEALGAATPHIDRLAQEGLRLTSVYSQPTCTPTRGTILTGRLPVRHGLLRPPQIGEKGGLEGEVTVATLLRGAGYHTAAVGKWHLGEAPAHQPQHNGFDEYYGFLGSIKNYTEWRDPRVNPVLANDPAVTRAIESNPDFNRNLVRATRDQPAEPVYELDLETVPEVDVDLMRYSVDFVRRMATGDQPFFLYHCFGKVHYDNYPAEGFRGRSAAKGVYQDAVVEVDELVGRLIAALEETGQDRDTLVFFTSDNGPNEDTWPDSGYTPFRGAKSTTWEGGVRVPGIAWWPGVIAPQRTSDGLFDLADLFATAADIGGARLPDDRYIDAVDQTSFLLSDGGSSNRETVFSYMGDVFSAMRVGPIKMHRFIMVAASDDGIPGFINGSTLQQTAGLYAFNLYLDPKERRPYGIRNVILLDRFAKLQRRHLATFQRYPPKVLIGLR